MKSVTAQTGRPDLTRDQFHTYYEEQHVPLAVKHFPFTGYARNHLVGAPDIWFGTITEFWARDLADLGTLLKGPVGALIAEDEAKFMHSERIAAGVAEEYPLSSGKPAAEGEERSIALISWNGVEASAAIAALEDWGRAIAADQQGVSFDLVQSSFYTSVPFPADALLWLPDFDAAPPAPARLDVVPIRVRRFESVPETLLGHRASPLL